MPSRRHPGRVMRAGPPAHHDMGCRGSTPSCGATHIQNSACLSCAPAVASLRAGAARGSRWASWMLSAAPIRARTRRAHTATHPLSSQPDARSPQLSIARPRPSRACNGARARMRHVGRIGSLSERCVVCCGPAGTESFGGDDQVIAGQGREAVFRRRGRRGDRHGEPSAPRDVQPCLRAIMGRTQPAVTPIAACDAARARACPDPTRPKRQPRPGRASHPPSSQPRGVSRPRMPCVDACAQRWRRSGGRPSPSAPTPPSPSPSPSTPLRAALHVS